MYDIIIIGGGIAGLATAIRFAPSKKVLLLEKYSTLGGRALTYKENGLQYEIGAGRVWHKHTHVNALVKRYGLHTYPISTKSNYDDAPNQFTTLFYPILKELLSLPAATLGKHTIQELLPPAFAPLLMMYPYRAELDMLRADLALPLFKPNDLMGSVSDDDYYGVVEGYVALVDGLAKDATKAGAVIKTRYHVDDIKRIRTDLFEVTGKHGKKDNKVPFQYQAKTVIIATCRCSLSGFSVLKGLPLLKQLQTSALCRIYAVFPTDKTKNQKKAWFHDIPKTVTANPLRYIIPINAEKGLIMISYTDGKDTDVWKSLDGDELETAIMAATKHQFPHKDIPKPTYLKKHMWPSGCTYWVPGDYDVKEAQAAAMNPSPNLFVVGESVAIHQEWMESALETVDLLPETL